MTFSADLAVKIAAEGFGTVGKEIVYGKNTEPFADAVLAVTIVDTPGNRGLRTHGRPGEGYGRPTAQITVRATRFKTAIETAENLRSMLDAVRNETIGSTYYVEIASAGPAFDMGPDAKGRARATFNVAAVGA